MSAVFEFICAQSPYSMRSILTSITYATEGLGSVVGVVVLAKPHYTMAIVAAQSFRIYIIAYYSVNAALAAVALAVAILNSKRYKARRRLDKKYEDAYADRVSILSSLTSSIEIIDN